jgi:hypothetical protein
LVPFSLEQSALDLVSPFPVFNLTLLATVGNALAATAFFGIASPTKTARVDTNCPIASIACCHVRGSLIVQNLFCKQDFFYQFKEKNMVLV